MAAHFGVLLLVILFVSLGFWQLRRLGERRLENQVVSARLAAAPEGLALMVAAAGTETDTLEFRRATASGHFVPEQEILLRSRVNDGVAGYGVLTPFVLDGGGAVLVDRGWVPLGLEPPPIAQAPPPAGEVEIEGLIRRSQTRPALGPVEPEGRLTTAARVDIPRLQEQFEWQLIPVYLELSGAAGPGLPVVSPPPSFTDEGPHLSYAVQWFGFAIISVVGYLFLVRRASNQSRAGRSSQPVDHLGTGDGEQA
jgi:surfeit locus 1 family protein